MFSSKKIRGIGNEIFLSPPFVKTLYQKINKKSNLKFNQKNMSQTIICPNCDTNIDLDKIADQKYSAILKQQETKLKQEQEEQRKSFDKQLEEEKKEMREKAKKFAEEQVDKERKKIELEMKDIQEQLKNADKKVDDANKKELGFMKKQRELEEKEKNFDLELEKKLLKEEKKIEEKLKIRQKEENEIIKEKLLKKSEEEFIEKLEKSEKIQEKIRKQEQEEFRKKEQELLKQQEQMKRALDDAKRKAEQWSQQIQWDIGEEDLKNAIIQAFPIDKVDDVATWVKWADLIQVVRNNLWQESWTIIWESKNTKTWTPSWIMKLKDDKLKANWNIAILVTSTLPKNLQSFWMIEDVMVCKPEYAIAVSTMLRDKLLAISKTEKSLQWKDIKMEMLYKYLSSEEFSWKISMMVDVFTQLKSWIDSERRSMEKNWKKREKDLERATFAITWMYWELESLMWQELPWAEKLSLDSGEEE